jgi:DNA adenine methylase
MSLRGTGLHRFVSPLRYPGGKGKIANFVKLLYLENGLVGSDYVEIYAGGASVALTLLFEEYASRVHINDLNRSVATFWKVVLENPDALCRRIRSASASMTQWRRQQAVQQATDPDEVDLASFSTALRARASSVAASSAARTKLARGSSTLDSIGRSLRDASSVSADFPAG